MISFNRRGMRPRGPDLLGIAPMNIPASVEIRGYGSARPRWLEERRGAAATVSFRLTLFHDNRTSAIRSESALSRPLLSPFSINPSNPNTVSSSSGIIRPRSSFIVSRHRFIKVARSAKLRQHRKPAFPRLRENRPASWSNSGFPTSLP
jgi:hypothetical protein